MAQRQQQQPQTWTTTESGGGQIVMQSQPVYIQSQPQQRRPVYVTQQTGGYYVGPCCNTPYFNSLPQRQRCKRLAAFILGIFAAFFLLIAMAENEPAEGYVDCGWTQVKGDGYYYQSISYSDICDEGIDAACQANVGGIISLLLLLFAFIFCICAVIWVNPFCYIQEYKCGTCYGKLFIITLILIICGIIAWFALGSTYCMSDKYLDSGVGTSMILSILSAILVAIAVGILYSP